MRQATNQTAYILNNIYNNGEKSYFYINQCDCLCWSHLTKEPNQEQRAFLENFENIDFSLKILLETA